MNERIKELAEQAKGFVDLNQHVGGEKGCMVYTYDGLEKFAELIVDQCFKVALVEGKGYLDPIKLRDAMKKHFGVEE